MKKQTSQTAALARLLDAQCAVLDAGMRAIRRYLGSLSSLRERGDINDEVFRVLRDAFCDRWGAEEGLSVIELSWATRFREEAVAKALTAMEAGGQRGHFLVKSNYATDGWRWKLVLVKPAPRSKEEQEMDGCL